MILFVRTISTMYVLYRKILGTRCHAVWPFGVLLLVSRPPHCLGVIVRTCVKRTLPEQAKESSGSILLGELVSRWSRVATSRHSSAEMLQMASGPRFLEALQVC